MRKSIRYNKSAKVSAKERRLIKQTDESKADIKIEVLKSTRGTS